GLPLRERAIRRADRSYLSRTPRLSRQPFDRVVAVRPFPHEWFEPSFRPKTTPHILGREDITSSRKICAAGSENLLVVGKPVQNARQILPRSLRKVEVRCQLHAVAHRDESLFRLRKSKTYGNQQENPQT